MAANSLRGGQRTYTPGTLGQNWPEARFEEKYQAKHSLDTFAMPTKSDGNWGKTSDDYGRSKAAEIKKKLGLNGKREIMKYQSLPPQQMYSTTTGRVHCDLQTIPDVTAHPATREKFDTTDEGRDFLQKYRETWTRGEPWQYQRKEL